MNLWQRILQAIRGTPPVPTPFEGDFHTRWLQSQRTASDDATEADRERRARTVERAFVPPRPKQGNGHAD